jgi:hypothetical protein
MKERDKKPDIKVARKLNYDPRKTSEALTNLTPLVFETLGENRDGESMQGYHTELEDKIVQRDPGEDREVTYGNACKTLRSQGISMQGVGNALLRDPRVTTALNLGNMTNEQYQMKLGILINSLADYYPGAKRQENKKRKHTSMLDW